ncbi:hypothetical protein M4R22_19990 [Acidovorax sp. GBBC 3334]|uniref:hypothetical protein n=1 Tax=Acidovorax sp. GBBC 3334 TaxID=2940496 RepID=UPI00230481B3|nr:hypothetical protein [Acidovorax sp. GBBC 3334]MDA8457046.1 hypothetical protein [Acidovorax sp. GBBC 3334]
MTPSRTNAPPPLPGMLPTQMDIAIRAYGRRAGLLRGGYTVRALKAVDQRLDALVAVCRYYGPACLEAAAAAYEQAAPFDRHGAAFVRVVLSEHHETDAPKRVALLGTLVQQHAGAVRDALWFYGAPDTCQHLLASPTPALRDLGVELAGRLALPAHLDGVHTAARDGADQDTCLLACALMGELPARTQEHWTSVLKGQDLARQITTLRALAVIGGHLLQPELRSYIGRLTAADGPSEASHPIGWAAAVDASMGLWAAREPEAALEAVVGGLRIPNETALRVVALAGKIQGLLPVLDFIERLDRPVAPAERDLLQLVFGQVPPELTSTQAVDPAARQGALRAMACDVFAANGCTGLEPGHITAWADPVTKDRLWALDAVRIRGASPLQPRTRLEQAFDVGHAMRGWLYHEHAAASGRAFPVLPEDLASRQMGAVEAVQLIAGLEDDGASP